ncbi:MAG: hypothetical protein M1834_001528 [Cirrosporium novae-zelandiae]|nr:MAG: hypothetical protein M1834_004045 [Cirrosporium novae-zelandiae]KAI9735513.1 MAG: hypothetical protein M1834_001528 [Cirrosporium novae-zelandiae]
MTNPLSSINVCEIIASSLSTDLSPSSQPHLKDPCAAIALHSYACMRAVGFRLKGFGEDHTVESQSSPDEIKPLPQEWTNYHAFRFTHPQSSLEFMIKINRLGNKVVILGIGLGDDKTASFDVPFKDFLSESSFPFTLPSTANKEARDRIIQDIFISPHRMSDLTSLFKINIIQKLVPGIHKEGYEESAQSSSRAPGEREGEPPLREPQGPVHDPLRNPHNPAPARPYPFDDPLAAPPRRPLPAGDFPPPGFDDELDINRPLRGIGDRNPLNIGERDLYPPGLGPHDPLGGPLGPGLGGRSGGGGMHPTLDDPLFGGGSGQGGYDPMAPPGARYDPLGPGDGRPSAPGGRRFPGGGPPNPFGGFGNDDFL